MVNRRFVARRALFAVLSFYGVVTLVFLVLALGPDPTGTLRVASGDLQTLLSASDGGQSFLARYAGFLWDVTTLNWGQSTAGFEQGPAVTALLAKHLPYTLTYAVPAVVVGVTGGIGLGVFAAVNNGGYVDRVIQSIGYFGFGIPNFFVAEVALFVLESELGLIDFTLGRINPKFYVVGETVDIWQPRHLAEFGVIAAILALSLVAGQLRYARSECLEYVTADFVKLARAKGASEYRVMLHVLRNAALPLIAMFLADLVTVLVVHVFVLEFVFNAPGIGQMGIQAVKARNLPFVIGITMTVAAVGVFANFVQDVGLGYVDPRTDAE